MTTAAQLQTLEWWTPRELSNRAGVSIETVRQWIAEGKVNAARIGGQDRIHQGEVYRVTRKGKAA